jgi:hypothetical protein
MSEFLQCSLCGEVFGSGELLEADLSALEAAGMASEALEFIYGTHSQCPVCLNNSANENFTPVELGDGDESCEFDF